MAATIVILLIDGVRAATSSKSEDSSFDPGDHVAVWCAYLHLLIVWVEHFDPDLFSLDWVYGIGKICFLLWSALLGGPIGL